MNIGAQGKPVVDGPGARRVVWPTTYRHAFSRAPFRDLFEPGLVGALLRGSLRTCIARRTQEFHRSFSPLRP